MKKIAFFYLILGIFLPSITAIASARYQQAFYDRATEKTIRVSSKISNDIYETAQKALENPDTPIWTKDSIYHLQWDPLRPFRMTEGHVQSGIIYHQDILTIDRIKTDFPKDNRKSFFILSPLLLIFCFVFHRFKENIVWIFISLIIWAIALDIAFDAFKNSTFFSMAVVISIFPLILNGVIKQKGLTAKINFTVFYLIIGCEIVFLMLGI